MSRFRRFRRSGSPEPTTPEPATAVEPAPEPTAPVEPAAPEPTEPEPEPTAVQPAVIEAPTVEQSLTPLPVVVSDDLIPAASDTPRASVRQDRRRRRLGIAAGVVGAVVLVGLFVVAATGGDNSTDVATDSPAVSRAKARAKLEAVTKRKRANRSTTTTAPDDSSSSTTVVTVTPDPGGGTTPTTSAANPSDPLDAVEVQEDPGGCRWDAVAEELFDTGTVTNNGTEVVDVEIEVTWLDSQGEMDNWSEATTLDPGASETWEVSTAWFEQPQGLVCQIELL